MPGKSAAIAERILDLTHKIAADVQKIEDGKEELRALALEHGAFTETIEGKGEVDVKGGVPAKFKGLVPVFSAEKFVELPESKQKKLEEDGLVTWVKEFTKAAKPSVTVRV